MSEMTYTTKEVADAVGIHVNTVRLYEDIGFLTKPERLKNGYRVYTALQLEQCRLARKAMRAEVLQNGLRKKAVEIVRLCALLDFDGSLTAASEYRAMIESEISAARAAAASAEAVLCSRPAPGSALLKRREAALSLSVTPETLRTWERSGLIDIRRGKNGYRVYSPEDMARLNIIRTLRCANYSLSAILRLLRGLDRNEASSVEALLNTPNDDEDIVSVCDRLILSLQSTAADAMELTHMIEKIKSDCQTIQ